MNKSTLIAVLVFVALVIGAVSTMQDKPERGVVRLSMAHVDAAAVDRLLLGADDGISIEKVDGRWRIDGKLADQTSVERLVDAVAGIESSDLASRNPDRFGALEVDDDKGVRVRLFAAGREIADLVVGSSAQGGSHVRAGGEVYAVRGVYRASFARDRASWVERRLFLDAEGDVTRVEVAVAGDPPYALVSRDGAWQLEETSAMPEGQRFDAEAASRLVRSLVTLRADEILDEEPEEAAGLADAGDRLTFHVEGDERARSLLLAAAGDGVVYARSSERERLATLRPPLADNLRVRLTDLRDLGIFRIDMQQAVRLELQDGADRLAFDKVDGAWQLSDKTVDVPDDFALDRAGVMRRLSDMSRAKALAEDPTAVFDVAAAMQKLVVTLGDGSTAVLAFGPESTWEGQAVAAAVGNADAKTYVVATALRDQLLRGLDSFARSEPAAGGGLGGLDPEALQNLPPEIRDSLLKQMAEEQQKQEMIRRAIEAAQ